ncbi:SGS domain-containing protein [Radiomyces spectabilis]|uniref:SGS domain-containing protein n=1 Tax=Radiomyces spectabilis TaxID=64574 RepID=UPI0022206C6A|nr:SGS domain-containing protein [Radiomyces spectabilis]KAI8376173.1 SGS domain-containing protein [Radiomyces spectabilis]
MSTAAEIYAKANDAFFDDDYDEALQLFGEAIELEPTNADFLLRRCVVYQKLNQLDHALSDASKALTLLETNQGARSLLARAHLQQGIVLHRLGRYAEAQRHLENSKELNPAEKTLVTWIRKNQEKIPQVTPPIVPLQPSSTATPPSIRARHEWFQNEKNVTVEIFIKNLQQDAVQVEFYDQSLSVVIRMPTGGEFSLELDPLAHEIVPKDSSFKILSTKVEIRLKKKMDGIMWGALEGNDGQGQPMASSETTKARQPKNWDKLVKEIDNDQDKPEGEAALNALFQQIYSNADDDTKRAMMKSFVESNGTCLSTNWSEVGSKKVETRPPEGMIAKKYDS